MTKVTAKNNPTKKQKIYTTESLKIAVDEVRNENINPYQTLKKYQIPIMTIVNHLKNRNQGFKMGRPNNLHLLLIKEN